MPARPTTALRRFAWRVGSRFGSRAVPLASLEVAPPVLGPDGSGRFMVLPAPPEAAVIP